MVTLKQDCCTAPLTGSGWRVVTKHWLYADRVPSTCGVGCMWKTPCMQGITQQWESPGRVLFMALPKDTSVQNTLYVRFPVMYDNIYTRWIVMHYFLIIEWQGSFFLFFASVTDHCFVGTIFIQVCCHGSAVHFMEYCDHCKRFLICECRRQNFLMPWSNYLMKK